MLISNGDHTNISRPNKITAHPLRQKEGGTKMTIQEAIKKVIEGGYPKVRVIPYEGAEMKICETLLDPSFWQALHPTINLTRFDDDGHMTEPWKNLAMNFWQEIMDGGTIEGFFEKL